MQRVTRVLLSWWVHISVSVHGHKLLYDIHTICFIMSVNVYVSYRHMNRPWFTVQDRR